MRGPRARAILFTDIVASTPLLEAAGDRYPDLLLRHRQLIEDAVRQQRGVTMPRDGDGCLALFDGTADAIIAAVAAERALTAERWPAGLDVEVRMLVHRGDLIDVDGEPVGMALHHAARMLSVGVARQVLVSSDAAVDATLLPVDATLVPAGEHRMRDLRGPVRLLQVDVPGLVVAIESAAPSDTMVGRDVEVAGLLAAIDGHRLVTITGPGGVGKTRLAREVVDRLDLAGVQTTWVELAGLSDPRLLPETALQAAGGTTTVDPVGDLVERLEGRRAILALDNCEHVVDAAARLVAELLRRCPDLKVLATSRQPLRLAAEVERPLEPLEIPLVGPATSASVVGGAASAVLFSRRAASVRPGFRVTPVNAAAVAEVCRRLDGLPLALEMAASRLRVLSVDQLVERLGDLDLLGRPTPEQRHRTMRAAIDWSHDLLDVDERSAFRRLSVFVGGFALDGAEAVLGAFGTERIAADDLVDRLLANGLIQADVDADPPRFRMLEPIRQYAAERLTDSGERSEAEAARTTWVIELAERSERELFYGQTAWLSRLRDEQGNLQSVLLSAIDSGDTVTAGRLAGALGYEWFTTGQVAARELLHLVLAMPGDLDGRTRARVLVGAGMMDQDAAEYEAALPLLREALQEFERCRSRRGQAWTLTWLARTPVPLVSDADAVDMLGRSIDLFVDVDFAPGQAWCHCFLAERMMAGADLDGAEREAAHALSLSTPDHILQTMGEALRLLGEIAARRGDFDGAVAYLQQSAELHGESGDLWQQSFVIAGLGFYAYVQGRDADGLDHYLRALELVGTIRSADRFAIVGTGLAPLLWRLGRRADAAMLLGAADRRRTDYPEQLVPFVAQVRTRQAEAFAAGAALTLDEIVVRTVDVVRAERRRLGEVGPDGA